VPSSERLLPVDKSSPQSAKTGEPAEETVTVEITENWEYLPDGYQVVAQTQTITITDSPVNIAIEPINGLSTDELPTDLLVVVDRQSANYTAAFNPHIYIAATDDDELGEIWYKVYTYGYNYWLTVVQNNANPQPILPGEYKIRIISPYIGDASGGIK